MKGTRWYLEEERAKGWKTRFNEKLIRRKPIFPMKMGKISVKQMARNS